MNIMFSHPYRLDMITKQENEVIMAMLTPDYINDKKTSEKIDIPVFTTNENRLRDMMYIIENGSLKPDVLIFNAPTDEESLSEAKLIEKIQSLGIIVVGQSLKSCQICNNKEITKKWLESYGFPTADSFDIKQVTEDDLPIVLKEVENSSGHGISLVSTIEELNKFKGKNVIAEKYIEGIEMSVQVVCKSSKYLVSPPVYKEKTDIDMIHPLKKLRIFPNPWKQELLNPQLKQVALEISQALCENGIIDIDFIVVNENEFYILEINSRLSGVSRMINIDGLNTMNLLLEIARNKDLPSLHEKYKITLEIPIQAQVTMENLNSSSNIDYIYVRPDQNDLRRRILISGDTREEIIQKGLELIQEGVLNIKYVKKIQSLLGSGGFVY
ncbi:ATP-grasp domain-containing protein [Lysinibacillus halotolerans]|nr:ATP-grasp domain-containing protein [Lysinibacillus halotolerans]